MKQDLSQVLRIPVYFLIRLLTGKKSLEACLVVATLIALVDWVFKSYLFSHYIQFLTSFLGADGASFKEIDLGYVPVVWIAFLGFIIGTLVIVITFAAQNIPKLIDLYMEEWWSLFLIWFIIGGGIHVLMIKLFNETGIFNDASILLNIHMLSLVGVLTFPYTFHVLKTTKTDNVIKQLLAQNFNLIKRLSRSRTQFSMRSSKAVAHSQKSLFEILNQLADLLAFAPFKEPKADIIQGIGELLGYYVERKSNISPNFFRISSEIQEDISFKTLENQISEIEKTETFYELKGLRVISEAYLTLLDADQFDLSALCAAQLDSIGTRAIKCGDQTVVDLIMVRFNTHFRSALKHAQRFNEARNLYNLVFHYGQFVNSLVDDHSIEKVKTCFFYLKFYSDECFKAGLNSPAVAFILDVIAFEMTKVLMQIHRDQWEFDIQEALLKDFLLLDNPSGVDRKEVSGFFISKSSIRVIQIGLGLYYLKHNMDKFAANVVNDTLQDLELMQKPQFIKVMKGVFARLRFSGPTFWEDTDRGNLNMYYTPHADQIEKFEQMQLEQMAHLKIA
ncbi:MAG: hypothetical protein HQM13_16045 [SAR324 cluster bacterium]|nr:hypothetical protein [SAR324 cluster bacterium]